MANCGWGSFVLVNCLLELKLVLRDNWPLYSSTVQGNPLLSIIMDGINFIFIKMKIKLLI